MLKKRLITGAVLVLSLLLALFYLPVTVFGYMSSLLVLVAGWEWSRLMGLSRPSGRVLYLLLLMMMLFNTIFIPVQLVMVISAAWWLLALFAVLLYPRASKCLQSLVLRGVAGLLVLVPCWVALVFMRAQPNGIDLLLLLFALTFGADTAAYFTGRWLGGRRLAPKVSPGKTIEGALGAIIFSIMLVMIVLWLTETPRELWLRGLLVSLLTVIFSMVGDLFESMMKRRAGVKDSGQWLPGHGGLLDRIDSLTASAPVFAFGLMFLMG